MRYRYTYGYVNGGSPFAVILSLAIIAYMVVVQWRIYKKAGAPGWAAIVPFYSSYVLYKIAWRKVWPFWVTLGSCVVAYLVMVFGIFAGLLTAGAGRNYAAFGISAVSVLLGVAAWIAVLVFGIITYVKLAGAFGKGGGFACGLIFLGPIFLGILAFGQAQYVGDGALDGEFIDAGGEEYPPQDE